MISQLEKTFASSYIWWTEVGSRTSSPAECQRPWDLEIMTNNWPWLFSTCFACISKHQADPPGARARMVTTFFMWKWDSQCRGSASYLFDFPLISHFYSLLYLHFTSHQPQVCVFVLPALLIPHPERAAAAAQPPGCFHEGVGREGLACRYEQTVTTDGSGVAAALLRPRCSLPPGWRPRPINPKPCHLFSTLWIQKGSCKGCFTGFSSSAHLSLDLFLLSVFGGCRAAALSTGSNLGDKEKKKGGMQLWMS